MFETLFQGDPLRLADLAATWMCQVGYLLDRRRLMQKTLAVVVMRLPGLEGDRDLQSWLRAIMEDAAWTLMYEESMEADANEPIPEPMEPRYLFLTKALGLEPVQLRRACMAINSLPEEERLAFHNMLVQRKGFGHYARERGMAAAEARDLLLSATRTVLDSLVRDRGSDA